MSTTKTQKIDVQQEVTKLLCKFNMAEIVGSTLTLEEKENKVTARALLSAVLDVLDSKIHFSVLPLDKRTQRTSQEDVSKLIEHHRKLSEGINNIYTKEVLSEGEFMVVAIAQSFLELFGVTMEQLG